MFYASEEKVVFAGHGHVEVVLLQVFFDEINVFDDEGQI